jgi:hypothetical protein
MRGVLVPTAVTRQAEITAAPETASTFGRAVDLLLRTPAEAQIPHPVGPPGGAGGTRPRLRAVA